MGWYSVAKQSLFSVARSIWRLQGAPPIEQPSWLNSRESAYNGTQGTHNSGAALRLLRAPMSGVGPPKKKYG